MMNQSECDFWCRLNTYQYNLLIQFLINTSEVFLSHIISEQKAKFCGKIFVKNSKIGHAILATIGEHFLGLLPSAFWKANRGWESIRLSIHAPESRHKSNFWHLRLQSCIVWKVRTFYLIYEKHIWNNFPLHFVMIKIAKLASLPLRNILIVTNVT